MGARWADGGRSMDRHWSRWCAFLEGHGYSPADFDRGALIQFVSTFGAEVPLGSHKLAIAALTTTYNMALGVDLNCVDGVSDQPLFYTKKAQRSDATAVAKPAKALRVQHALDPLPYIRYWDSQPPNSELSDQELTLKTVVLLRLAGFRAVDLARMPAGVGAGFRWPDEGLELRSFNTKTRNSKQDVERGGWTNWSLLREVDPSRVMAAWQALGLGLVQPENVCAVRAFRELARRLADTWALHGMLAFRAPHKGGVLGGVKCLAPGCFLHMVPVQHNICCVADAQLLSAWVRNFHTVGPSVPQGSRVPWYGATRRSLAWDSSARPGFPPAAPWLAGRLPQPDPSHGHCHCQEILSPAFGRIASGSDRPSLAGRS